jgi:hypothetical protein
VIAEIGKDQDRGEKPDGRSETARLRSRLPEGQDSEHEQQAGGWNRNDSLR